MYYRLVCSEPRSPSRGQCTGLLPKILYYETLSLMRPNKLVLGEPKLPLTPPTHTHIHTPTPRFLSLFSFCPLSSSPLCAIICTNCRDYEFALFMTRIPFISKAGQPAAAAERGLAPGLHIRIHAHNLLCVCVDEGSKCEGSPFTASLLGPRPFL